MKLEITIGIEDLLAFREQTGLEDFPISFSPLAGNGFSGVKGSGNDLYGIREYLPGDSLKRMNRQATARTGKIHLNEYLEERVLSAYVLLDQSPYLFFTSTGRMKSVMAAEKAAEIVFHYLMHGHRVGGEVFNGQTFADFTATTSEIACKEWLNKVVEFNRALPASRSIERKQGLQQALERCLNRNLSGREMYIVTDWMQCEQKICKDLLTTLSRENRVFLIQLTDILEEKPPLKVLLEGERGGFELRTEMERQSYMEWRAERKENWKRWSQQFHGMWMECFT